MVSWKEPPKHSEPEYEQCQKFHLIGRKIFKADMYMYHPSKSCAIKWKRMKRTEKIKFDLKKNGKKNFKMLKENTAMSLLVKCMTFWFVTHRMTRYLNNS